MNKFAVVVLLPQDPDNPTRADFNCREFETWDEFATFMKDELEVHVPNWQVVTVCHVEDLPLLMEPPDAS